MIVQWLGDVCRANQGGGSFTTGERMINEDQADILRRIYGEFASGHSPRATAGNLNKETIGEGWGMTAHKNTGPSEEAIT